MLYEFKISSSSITVKKYKILRRLPRTIEYALTTPEGNIIPTRILKHKLNIVNYNKVHSLSESEGRDALVDHFRNRISLSKRYVNMLNCLLKQVQDGKIIKQEKGVRI